MHTIDAHEGEIAELTSELAERNAQLGELQNVCEEMLRE